MCVAKSRWERRQRIALQIVIALELPVLAWDLGPMTTALISAGLLNLAVLVLLLEVRIIHPLVQRWDLADAKLEGELIRAKRDSDDRLGLPWSYHPVPELPRPRWQRVVTRLDFVPRTSNDRIAHALALNLPPGPLLKAMDESPDEGRP